MVNKNIEVTIMDVYEYDPDVMATLGVVYLFAYPKLITHYVTFNTCTFT